MGGQGWNAEPVCWQGVGTCIATYVAFHVRQAAGLLVSTMTDVGAAEPYEVELQTMHSKLHTNMHTHKLNTYILQASHEVTLTLIASDDSTAQYVLHNNKLLHLPPLPIPGSHRSHSHDHYNVKDVHTFAPSLTTSHTSRTNTRYRPPVRYNHP